MKSVVATEVTVDVPTYQINIVSHQRKQHWIIQKATRK